jgi:hypothetical protein
MPTLLGWGDPRLASPGSKKHAAPGQIENSGSAAVSVQRCVVVEASGIVRAPLPASRAERVPPRALVSASPVTPLQFQSMPPRRRAQPPPRKPRAVPPPLQLPLRPAPLRPAPASAEPVALFPAPPPLISHGLTEEFRAVAAPPVPARPVVRASGWRQLVERWFLGRVA